MTNKKNYTSTIPGLKICISQAGKNLFAKFPSTKNFSFPAFDINKNKQNSTEVIITEKKGQRSLEMPRQLVLWPNA